MANCIPKLAGNNFMYLIFTILALAHTIKGKPRIAGPKEIISKIRQNVSIECWGNKTVLWYHLINTTDGSTSFVNEESKTSHLDLRVELPDYTEWPDVLANHIEENLAVLHIDPIKANDAGVYICTYEREITHINETIKKIKEKHFSTVRLIVKIVKPVIDGGENVNVLFGDDVNLTCSGENPVTWVLKKNSTWGIQHTERTTSGKTTYFSILKIKNVNYTNNGYFICKLSDGINAPYDDFDHEADVNYAFTYLFVKDVKPTIDVGDSVVVSSGDNVNMTCSGKRPVTWVLMNNHTWGIQHTENVTLGKTEYFSILEIQKVNYSDVGYFICKFSDGINTLYEDFDHEADMNSASTYLFVKDLDHLLVRHDWDEISAPLSSKVIVPCKPTFPEVNVSLRALDNSMILHDIFDPRKGFVIDKTSKKNHEGFWQCIGEFGNDNSESQLIFITVHYNPVLTSVNLTVDGAWQVNSLERKTHTYDVVEGDVLFVNCSTNYKRNYAKIMWKTPLESQQNTRHEIRQHDSEDNTLDMRIITDVSIEKDSGLYTCYVTNEHVNSSAYAFALNVFAYDSAHLELKAQNENALLIKSSKYPEPLIWIIFFRAYPALYLNWTINGEVKIIYKIETNEIDHEKPMVKRKEQYEIKINWAEGEITLKIHFPSIRDTGIYILSAEVPGKSNSIKKNVTLRFFKKGAPEEVITLIGPADLSKKYGTKTSVKCSAYGYPSPILKVFFKPCSSHEDCDNEDFIDVEVSQRNDETLSKLTSKRELTSLSSVRWSGIAKMQGYYICMASNRFGSKNSTEKSLIISDSGFESSDFLQIEIVKDDISFIAGTEASFIEGDTVKLTCRGNTFMTSSPLYWMVKRVDNSSFSLSTKRFPFHEPNTTINVLQTNFSYISRIETRITKEMDGICLACLDSSSDVMEHLINITVIDASPPIWMSKPLNKIHYVKNENEKLSLDCSGEGIPKPSVTWFKNDKKIELDENDRRISIYEGNLNFEFLFPEDSGKYLCRIKNREDTLEDYITLEVKDPDAAPQIFLIIIIGVVSFLFLILVIIFAIRVYRDKKAKQMFALEVQKRFIEGNPESLNPDLDLGEQADLLPYDNKFEFPRDRVTIENLLGSGAFGNVFKATATDLISGASKTTVAVKMMKSPANGAQMKTLISELKIMIHIGRHINIVNLLGACSKNMASKGELLLIVEYCRHGSILEYMRRHKSEFLNQINEYDKIDPNVTYFRKRTYSNPRTSVRAPTYALLDLRRNSTYLPNNNNSNGSTNNSVSFSENNSIADYSGRKRFHSESAANDVIINTDMTMATIVNSADNYISESTLEQRGPLCSKDLLHWAYQISNGMFYLSEKKVIHGDLAARNILLADKNVVKISDFGLSKNIYKQEHYKKKSECPLPVKWLALEALRDSIFSTHSDVWSYGVVLWEIFSLGSNPFAGVEVDAQFITKLEEGLRMKHPLFATSDLYQIMMRCWQKNPNDRPSFRHLEKTLGDMLGETEKQMYMTLNAYYEEDNYISEHLKLLNTPSYDSRVKGFFPEKDEFGYEVTLQSPGPGIIMEERMGLLAGNSENRFMLEAVPKKRKSHALNGVQNAEEEKESLIEETQNSDYLIMKSPTKNEESQFTFDYIPMPETNVSNVTYTNVPRLNEHNAVNAEQNSCQEMTTESLESPKPFLKVTNSVNDEDGNIFTFNEMNPAENDSVFSSEEFGDDASEKKINFKPQTTGYATGNRYRKQSYHNKHDSGIYSPNILQNNPIYNQTSNLSNDKSNSLPHQRTFQQRESENRISDVNRINSPSEWKRRNQSDSSSGFGSLTDDHHPSSFEKYKMDNPKEKTLLEHQNKLEETKCV